MGAHTHTTRTYNTHTMRKRKKTNLHDVLLSISLFTGDVCNDAYNRAFEKKKDHYYLFV